MLEPIHLDNKIPVALSQPSKSLSEPLRTEATLIDE